MKYSSDRHSPEAVGHAILTGGKIRMESLRKFIELYPKKAKHTFHIEIVVETPALFKTIDNEADLQETLSRLVAAPDLEKKDANPHHRGEEGGKDNPRE